MLFRSPINWAIINGEKETGVTTFKLKHEIDTGDILLQENFPIGENENAGDIHDKMKEVGAQLLLKTVIGLAEGSLTEAPQNNKQQTINHKLKHAPKIFTETCKIDFTKPVDEVYNLIRGLAPYLAAFTFLNGKKLKVYKVDKEIKCLQLLQANLKPTTKHFCNLPAAMVISLFLNYNWKAKKKWILLPF